MKQPNLLQFLLFFVIFLPGAAVAYLGVTAGNYTALWAPAVTLVLGLLAASSLQIADQWEKAVVLRLGNFTGLRARELSSFCQSWSRSSTGSIHG
jgi:hypothetical protein